MKLSSVLDPCRLFFFFNDTATTEIYTLSLHDALRDLELLHDRRARSLVAAEGEPDRLPLDLLEGEAAHEHGVVVPGVARRGAGVLEGDRARRHDEPLVAEQQRPLDHV